MAKNIPRPETPKLDMNPMVDMAFLLVSFFMLATTFKTAEPILINRPSSHSELKMPETDVMTISVGKEGQVFCAIDGKFAKKRLIQLIGEKYNIDFSEEEQEQFALLSGFGLPIEQLQSYLQTSPEDRVNIAQTGIPSDADELINWVALSRMANPKLRIAINADKDTAYTQIKKVIDILLEHKIYRFNLITEVEKDN
ncbi:MAG: biopolymer transporter ExbD [Saprospiraceae bacterium]|nr:biopolymer transporter ExbD [Saprospiraceae bacterium]